MPAPSSPSRSVVSARLVIVFQQRIALLTDASKGLKDLHCSLSPRETIGFRFSRPCGGGNSVDIFSVETLNSLHWSESEAFTGFNLQAF